MKICFPAKTIPLNSAGMKLCPWHEEIMAFDQPSHAFIASLARKLNEDLKLLRESFEFTQSALQELRKRKQVEFIHDYIDVEFTAWVLARFKLNHEHFMGYLEHSLDAHNKLKNDLFSLGTPDKIDPEPAAEAHLDRIDMAINFLANWLKMDLPYTLRGSAEGGYTIRL